MIFFIGTGRLLIHSLNGVITGSWMRSRKVRVCIVLSCEFMCSIWSLGDLTTSFELSLPLFDCLCKPHVLTEVTIIFLHLHKLCNAHLPDIQQMPSSPHSKYPGVVSSPSPFPMPSPKSSTRIPNKVVTDIYRRRRVRLVSRCGHDDEKSELVHFCSALYQRRTYC